VNLRHLAKLAKLSPAAVSLALRNSPKISPATRARVKKIAAKAGYRPDANVVEMMKRLRRPGIRQHASLAVISFYEQADPWKQSVHLGRIYDGMEWRSAELGYRLDPIWLRSRGMTYRRLRGILEARCIEGILCFGSPDMDQDFPGEINNCAVVTVGLSIRTPLHRVTSHLYNDTVRALNEIYQRGYRRPGLVVAQHEETRGGHAHTSAYLGWCERRLGPAGALPVLLIDRVEEQPLLVWLEAHRPDVVIFVHHHQGLAEFAAFLDRRGIRLPRSFGVAVLTDVLTDTRFSGLQQNHRLMGAWAVELLVARIANRDVGIPNYPRVEMIEGQWLEHQSLAKVGGFHGQATGPEGQVLGT